MITGKQISRSEGHTRPSSSNSSAIQLSPDTSMDIQMDISQENRLTLPSPSTVNIPPRIKSVNDTLDPSLSVAKSEVEVQETDLQIVRARNSNEFVVHMIQPESKSNNRKSVTTMESTEESDFGLHLPENKPLESIKPDKADQMMEYVSRVVYATLTLFQCSPYVSLLKTQYSAIYNQLLDSFNDMKDFVMTEIHTNT